MYSSFGSYTICKNIEHFGNDGITETKHNNTLSEDDLTKKYIFFNKWTHITNVPLIFYNMSMHSGIICAITARNELYYADQYIFSNPNWTKIDGSFSHVNTINKKLYVVKTDNKLYFSPTYQVPTWTDLKLDNVINIIVNGNILFAKTNDLNLNYATDSIETIPNWKTIPGKYFFLDISFMNNTLYGLIMNGSNQSSIVYISFPDFMNGLEWTKSSIDLPMDSFKDNSPYTKLFCYNDMFFITDYRSSNVLINNIWHKLPFIFMHITGHNNGFYMSTTDKVFAIGTDPILTDNQKMALVDKYNAAKPYLNNFKNSLIKFLATPGTIKNLLIGGGVLFVMFVIIFILFIILVKK